MCTSMQKADTSFGSVLVALSLVQIVWSTGLTFIPCEVGERTSAAFFEVYDSINLDLDWYLFPIETQKMLPIILINTQTPVAIEIFGSISCKRDSFKRVSSQHTAILFTRIVFNINFAFDYPFRLLIALSRTLWCSVNSIYKVSISGENAIVRLKNQSINHSIQHVQWIKIS